MSRGIVILTLSLLLSGTATATTVFKIVGGQRAAETNELEQRTVLIVDPRGDFCTGTLIAEDLILTAAHCVSATPAESRTLQFYHRARNGQVTMETREVVRFVRHPKFGEIFDGGFAPEFDLALIHFAGGLPKDSSPAELPDSFDPKLKQDLWIAGYGDRKDGTPLQKGEFSFGAVRPETLLVRSSVQSELPQLVLRGRPQTCLGDSGGPLFLKKDGHIFLVGVTSYGDDQGCSQSSNFEIVTEHLIWIREASQQLRAP